MTYDCRRGIPTQYCVHFMSREPTMDEGVLQVALHEKVPNVLSRCHTKRRMGTPMTTTF